MPHIADVWAMHDGLMLSVALSGAGEIPLAAVVLVGFGVTLAAYLLVRARLRREPPHGANPSGVARERSPAIQAHESPAEATERAERLSAELDRKAARLEALVQDADEAMRRLRRMQAAMEDAHRPAPEPDDGDSDPAVQRIHDLADEGLDSVQIARRLDQHVGKVQLILALRAR